MHDPYRVALQAEMVSMLAKYVPGGVWTPAARVLALARLPARPNTPIVLASILLEAVLSAISGVIVFVVSLAWVHGVDAPLAPLILFAVLSGDPLHPRVFSPLARRLLKPFGVGRSRRCRSRRWSPARLLLPHWLIGGVGLYFLIRSVGDDPGLRRSRSLAAPPRSARSSRCSRSSRPRARRPRGVDVRAAARRHSERRRWRDVLNRLAITLVELALFGSASSPGACRGPVAPSRRRMRPPSYFPRK